MGTTAQRGALAPAPAAGSPPAAGEPLLGIGAAAERAGVSERALRYYQQLGLLVPACTPGGLRRYSEEDLARVARIRELQTLLGLNLDEIAVVLRNEDRLAEIRLSYHDERTSDEDRRRLTRECLTLQESLRDTVKAKKAALEGFLNDLDFRIRKCRDLLWPATRNRALASRTPPCRIPVIMTGARPHPVAIARSTGSRPPGEADGRTRRPGAGPVRQLQALARTRLAAMARQHPCAGTRPGNSMSATVIAYDQGMGRWEPDARGRLERAAMELYIERGFEQTTVTEIASAGRADAADVLPALSPTSARSCSRAPGSWRSSSCAPSTARWIPRRRSTR